MLRIPLLVFLIFGFLAPQQVPAPREVTCTNCVGEGSFQQKCPICEGKKKGPCPECAVDTSAISFKHIVDVTALTDLDLSKKIANSHEEVTKAIETFSKVMGGVKHLVKIGYTACPANCVGGVSVLFRGHACKVCKGKGALKCSTCKGKGQSYCTLCRKTGKLVFTCPECVGAGKANDPLLRTVSADTCPWCLDASWLACHSCDEEGHGESVCRTCRGEGQLSCRTCKGSRKRSCNKCMGTGDLSLSNNPKSRICDKCKKKGTLPCVDCEKGYIDCGVCQGTGQRSGACYYCLGEKKALCGGCLDGASTAWVAAAKRLSQGGKFEEASAHLVVAIERAENRKEKHLAALAGDKDRMKDLKRKLDAQVRALRKEQVEAQKLAEQ